VGVVAGVGEGDGSGAVDFGPGQAVRRNAKATVDQTRIEGCRIESVRMNRRYPACQTIAVNTIQIPLRTIIGIAGIGFFLAA